MAYANVPCWTQEMFNEAVCNNPWVLRFVPDHFKTEEVCNKAIESCPFQVKYAPDHFKNKKCAIRQ